MKVNNLFCYFYCVEITQTKLFHIMLDIFENLTMNTGALNWVEIFWSCNAKVNNY
jgi:hypothetical protein